MDTVQNNIESTGYINGPDLYEVLQKKGVGTFHHANTVKTSLSFIKEKALLSRHYVEQNALIQTEQYTDEKDKSLGIWDSVFLDGLDLHKKFYGQNKYGPILFHIGLDILRHPDFAKIRVTKSNPDSWPNDKSNFYDSIEGIKNDYLTGDNFKDGKIMFLFDQPGKKISLLRYCRKIVIDNSFITLKKGPISEMVKVTISDALKDSELDTVEIEIRQHVAGIRCACRDQYLRLFEGNRDQFDKLFKSSDK